MTNIQDFLRVGSSICKNSENIVSYIEQERSISSSVYSRSGLKNLTLYQKDIKGESSRVNAMLDELEQSKVLVKIAAETMIASLVSSSKKLLSRSTRRPTKLKVYFTDKETSFACEESIYISNSQIEKDKSYNKSATIGVIWHELLHIFYSDFVVEHNKKKSFMLKNIENILEDAYIEFVSNEVFGGYAVLLASTRKHFFPPYTKEDIEKASPFTKAFSIVFSLCRDTAIANNTLSIIYEDSSFIAAHEEGLDKLYEQLYLFKNKLHKLKIENPKSDFETNSEEILSVLNTYFKKADQTDDDKSEEEESNDEKKSEGKGTKSETSEESNDEQSEEEQLMETVLRKIVESIINSSLSEESKKEETIKTGTATESDDDDDDDAEKEEEVNDIYEPPKDRDDTLSPASYQVIRGLFRISEHPIGVVEQVLRGKNKNEYNDIKQAAKADIQRLAANLKYLSQSKALKSKNELTGKLNLKQVAKIATDSPDVYKKHAWIKSSEYDIKILVDNSGSMSSRTKNRDENLVISRIDAAKRAAITIVEACKIVKGISVEVFGHTTRDSDVLLLETTTRENPTPFGIAEMIADSGNYDAEATEFICKKILRSRNHHNTVLLVISDGSPCSGNSALSGEQSVRLVTDYYEKRGIKIVHVPIVEVNSKEMYNHYIKSDSASLTNDLGKVISKILKESKKVVA